MHHQHSLQYQGINHRASLTWGTIASVHNTILDTKIQIKTYLCLAYHQNEAHAMFAIQDDDGQSQTGVKSCAPDSSTKIPVPPS
jgi:hypothetical protein